jgi:hypothetical protein
MPIKGFPAAGDGYLLWVDVSCRLIQYQYLVIAQYGSSQAYQLSLPHAEIASSLLNLYIQAIYGRFQVNLENKTEF